MFKKFINWLWYSPDWYWTNRETGEKKDSPANLKIAVIASWLVAIFTVFAVLFRW